MKKLVLFLSFTLLFVIGNQQIGAQEKIEAKTQLGDVSASEAKFIKKTVLDLSRHLGLNDAQKVEIEKVLITSNQKMKDLKTIEDAQQRKEHSTKVQTYVNSEMKGLLSESQYEKYLVLMKRE